MNTEIAEIANVITTEKLNEQFEFFESEDFGRLEILVINGKIYFPATESAKTLGYSNPQKAIRDHCLEDGCTIRSVIDRLGRTQQKKYINEGNLYRLIVKSKLPSAHKFEKWVFDEVKKLIVIGKPFSFVVTYITAIIYIFVIIHFNNFLSKYLLFRYNLLEFSSMEIFYAINDYTVIKYHIYFILRIRFIFRISFKTV